MEKLQRLEGVNILKGQVRAEWVERGHMAVENTGEHRRMLRMKLYDIHQHRALLIHPCKMGKFVSGVHLEPLLLPRAQNMFHQLEILPMQQWPKVDISHQINFII